MKMQKIQFKGVEDLTEENLNLFKEGIDEIKAKYTHKRFLLEGNGKPHFSSIEQYMKYYDAIPLEDFDKKFRNEV